MNALTAVQQPKAPTPSGADRLVQRTCACDNHSLGGACANCQKKRVQPRLVVGTPGDALEQQAERVADAVTSSQRTGGDFSRVPASASAMSNHRASNALQRLAPLVPVADAALLLQPAADPDEREADAAAVSAMDGPAVEESGQDDEEEGAGEGEELEEDDVPLQAKHVSGALLQRDANDREDVQQGIDRQRSGGSAIEAPVRQSMESAFGADFSGVRVHTDAAAASLAASVQALAFTSGRDIFFGRGKYQPGSSSGAHLLAHELAHVLQQGAGASPLVAPAAPAALQRKPDDSSKDAPKLLGTQYFFDASDNIIEEVQIVALSDVLGQIRPGYYEVKMTAIKAGVYTVQVVRAGTFTQTSKNAEKINAALAKTKRIFLRVYLPPDAQKPKEEEGEQKEQDKKEEEDKPTPEDLTGPSAPPGAAPDEKPDSGTPPPAKGGDAGTGQKPAVDEKAGDKGAGAKGGDKGESEKGDKKGEGEKGTAVMSGGGDKAGAGAGGKGGKYGWLGLFDLPAPLVKFLETAIDVLGDGEELQALQESLRTLQELAEHRDELVAIFSDPETLLEVALGLRENTAMDAIEKWVARDTGKSPKPAKKPSSRGIVGLAVKIVALVGKLRKMLKPVFKVRGGVQSALGGAALILEGIPVLEQLLELTKDPSKVSALSLQSAADQFATDFAAEFKPKLDKAPQQLKAAFVHFEEADLVSYEALARGVTAALLMAVPKTYKPIVLIARETGLEQAIADNVVAKLIPKEALDGVNDVVRSLVKMAEPTINDAVTDLERIIAELGPGFLEEMPQEVLSALKPSRKAGRPSRRPSPVAVAGLIDASSGEPLDDETRTDAETRLGHDFSDVRVHRDTLAGAAGELMNANAFTVGSHVFFGPGKFAPKSTDGQRLLYHELTHTAQQAQGGLDLQPSYKDLLKRLAKECTRKVINQLKGAKTTSPTKQKQVAAIKDQVEKLRGRQVVSRTNPTLPTGYTYIPKATGKIRTIRRALSWIRFIPALTIDKRRRIQLTLTLSSFSPENAARAALRAALGCDGKTQQAHHCIPLELYFNPVVKTAVKNGFRFNGVDNGVCVSNKIHSGSHKNYTTDVSARLQNLASFRDDWAKLQKPFLALVADLKSEVKKRRKKLT